MSEDKEVKQKSSYRRVAIATCFGTFLEWYDFLTFASLAVIFGPLFFPSSDPNTGLLASLATFGVGMVARPIGSALFGSLGDRIGRKPVFMITIGLMGATTVAVGFLPTYSQIGIWAPVLLVMLRLVQGLSAGGEIGGGAVYLAEHAGDSNRGFKTSFLQLMGPLGILASTIQISILQNHLTTDEFLDWGWRVPFWFSLLLLLVAFTVRKSIEETPVYLKIYNMQNQLGSPLKNSIKDLETRKKMFLLFFCISGSGAVLFFCVQVYAPIFMRISLKLPPTIVEQIIIIATIFLLSITILSGWLSDKYGRKPILLLGLSLGSILLLPGFIALEKIAQNLNLDPLTSSILITGIMVLLSTSLAFVVGPQTALLAELFCASNRNSAATLSHNLAAGWIGGSLPLIVTWLNQIFENETLGLWYPTIFLAVATLMAIIYLPETVESSLFP